MRKNNLLIIVGVTVVAVGVIIAVIIASISNGTEHGSSAVSPQSSISDDVSDNSSGGNLPFDVSVDVPATSGSESNALSSGAEGIVATANSLIGVPFKDNGADTNGFDNSGFIYYVLRQNGYITCPRTTREQMEMGTKLTLSQLKPGDLAFFSEDGAEGSVFGGIYIGNGKMIGCMMPGQTVKVIDITNSYYKSNFCHGIGLS